MIELAGDVSGRRLLDAGCGFRISVVSEPPFSPETPPEPFPPGIGDQKAFICFIFFVLEAR